MNRHDSPFTHAGALLPGVGVVTRVKRLVGLRARLLGKYHRNTGMFFLETESGDRVKLVVHKPSDTGAPTITAADRLSRFRCSHCVPRVLYVDREHLALEFVPGQILSASHVDARIARDLGMFVARFQRDLEDPVPVWDALRKDLNVLLEGAFLDASTAQNALEYCDRLKAEAMTGPSAICFVDPVLKNFVLNEHYEIVFIDAFGVAPDPVGTAFVKQALRIPVAIRKVFMDAFFDTSSHGDHVRAYLPLYCRAHLADRTARRIGDFVRAHSPGRTVSRRRHRRRVFIETREQLVDCLALPADADRYVQWLADRPIAR